MEMNKTNAAILFLLVIFSLQPLSMVSAEDPDGLRVLNFQADNGFQHRSKKVALAMIESLGKANQWEVITTVEASSLTKLDLSRFDVIVFNNNCGNKGAIMTPKEQLALQKFVQNGGGFVGIHCAGAIWKEGGKFQPWYEGLIGTKLIDHPKVQEAKLNVEDQTHIATRHLPKEWIVTDEWHRFGSNPRENVDVLISVDEDSYKGKQKMGGDHPFTWCQQYDGGRSFFTSLGHTNEIYADSNFQKLIKGAIIWASGKGEAASDGAKPQAKAPVKNPAKAVAASPLPITKGLILDLDADKGVHLEEGGDKVNSWRNQIVGSAADDFVKQDEGRKVAGSGMPELKRNEVAIGGHNTLVFREQELINKEEDVFDHLITGSGYTWFSVMSRYEQIRGKKDVNSFFGNLRNGPNYEGLWGNLMDDSRVWMGTRNGIKVGEGKPTLWDEKMNPLVVSPKPLEINRYYLIMGRMGAGQGNVNLDLYVNSADPVDSKKVPVNPKANPSKMAIGQERDATNHPGKESFSGEIARFLIFERPLTDEELKTMIAHLSKTYSLNTATSKSPSTNMEPAAPKVSTKAQGTKPQVIGHWSFDGHTKDISEKENNGTVKGQELKYVEGKHGQAAEFRGATTVNCGDVPLGTKGQLTVALWVKPNRVEQAFAGFVQKQNLEYTERSFWMGQHPQDGVFAWAFFKPTTAKGRQLKTPKPVLANGKWTHVAITHDGNVQKIFVNGELNSTSAEWKFGIEDGGDNLRFGRVENTRGGWYSGLMDDIWMYDQALPEEEIKRLMNGMPQQDPETQGAKHGN